LLSLQPMGSEDQVSKVTDRCSALIGFARLTTKLALLLALVTALMYEMHEYSQLVVPIREQRMVAAEQGTDHVAETLLGLGAPEKKAGQLSEAVKNAARATDLPWQLLIALMYTESTFKENAVSEKNYKGLMQIPQEIPYPDANILVGARILEDKVRIANGDLHTALAMYKGGRDKPKARSYAAHTLAVYKRLKDQKGGPGTHERQRH